MVVFAMLFFLQAEVPVPPPPAAADEAEIVVMAKKSKRWEGSWWMENGQTSCKTMVSSGDADIDKIGCDILLSCGPLHAEEMFDLVRKAQAGGRIKSLKDQRKVASVPMRKIQNCTREKWRPALRELWAQRRKADKGVVE
jgi:hypothetical protein